MSTSKIVSIVIAGLIVLLVIIGVSTSISTKNTEVKLRAEVVAQQDVCKANFDKMYKVISQLAQIPERFADKSKEAFKEIYPQLMNGRYANDNASLMKWVQESNPTYDMAAVGRLYEKLANAIEANRDEYFIEQKKLIDMKREHSAYIKTWPASIFVGDRGEVDIVIVTSTTTENAYKTGKDDNVELFK
jgi:hypothetical protein